jgi:anti-sigma B factor antagonist
MESRLNRGEALVINHSSSEDGSTTILTVSGCIDSESALEIEAVIYDLLRAGKQRFALNATNIDFVSSSGIGAVLHYDRIISSYNGCFAVYRLNPELQSLFSVLGIDRRIHLASSEQEAVHLLNSPQLRAEGTSTGVVIIDHATGVQRDLSVEPPHAGNAVSPSASLAHPLIAECVHCKALIRVTHSGEYLCPECHSPFTVKPDHTLLF